MPIIERAIEMLERQPAGTLPLSELHHLLLRELGSEAGTYHQLYEALKQPQKRLFLLERRAPLETVHGWPRALVDQYGSALRADTMVMLRDPLTDAESGTLPAAFTTLQSLVEGGLGRAVPEEMVAAINELRAVQQVLGAAEPSTSPPLDPLPPP